MVVNFTVFCCLDFCDTIKFGNHKLDLTFNGANVDDLDLESLPPLKKRILNTYNLLTSSKSQADDSRRKYLILKLGIIHMSIAIDCAKQYDSFTGLQMGLPDVLVAGGWPADWAFTLFGLFARLYSNLDKHSYIPSRSRLELAEKFRVLLFNNYCRKLRGIKLISFVAKFFAVVHYEVPYDAARRNDMKDITDIGMYIVRKYDQEKKINFPEPIIPEFRIYFGFVILFLELISFEHDLGQASKLVNYEDSITYAGLNNLWRFLLLARKLLRLRIDGSKFDKRETVHRFVLNSGCSVRWQKAIVVINRLFTNKEQNEHSHFVLRWKHQLGLANQQDVQNRKDEYYV